MDYVLALLVGVFVSLGVYLLLSRSVIRMILGMTILGNGVNLLIFTAGRVTRGVAAIVPPWTSTKPLAMARPRPVPARRLSPASAR